MVCPEQTNFELQDKQDHRSDKISQFIGEVKKMRALLTILLLLSVTIYGASAKDVQVKDYTKKDGTHVAGYTRHEKDPDPNTVKVKGYTKKDGTKVAGYTRKKASK
jgi:hypothetical protein